MDKLPLGYESPDYKAKQREKANNAAAIGCLLSGLLGVVLLPLILMTGWFGIVRLIVWINGSPELANLLWFEIPLCWGGLLFGPVIGPLCFFVIARRINERRKQSQDASRSV